MFKARRAEVQKVDFAAFYLHTVLLFSFMPWIANHARTNKNGLTLHNIRLEKIV